MKSAKLIRVNGTDKQTLGAVITGNSKEIFVCRSLELPWKNNEDNLSCIPAGEYICKWSKSPHLSEIKGEDVYTYEILNVPHRAGIRIHSANYYTQILGCVALGDAHKDINSDGTLDVIHTGETVKNFAEFMNHEDFRLIIEA